MYAESLLFSMCTMFGIFDIACLCHGTDSIAVRLEDGPGKCAGRVEINYEGQWQRATHQGWTLSNSAAVCHSLRCGKHRSASTEIFSQGSVKFLDKDVKCDSDNSDISECIKGNTALSNKPVMITCEGKWFMFFCFQLRPPLLCLTVSCQSHAVS